MDGDAPKIEIFKPFGEALALTKRILFQPFDFKKWLIIGFAAFLTYLNGGGFTGFRPPMSGNWMNHFPNDRGDLRAFIEQLDPVWMGLIAVVLILAIAIIIVLTWVRSRGHFVFIDCVVRNRAAIVEPWNEYRAEGNSYFVFALLLTLATLCVVGVVVVLIIGGAALVEHRQVGAPVGVLGLILGGIGLFLFLILFGTVIQFVAPLMYRRRCKAGAAFAEILRTLSQHLGVFVLFCLFSMVLGLAVAILIVAATCMTCCIAAIPYVGTVILLPVFVFLQSFSLLFLRQFGSDYDVWDGIPQSEGPRLPGTPPPIQT